LKRSADSSSCLARHRSTRSVVLEGGHVPNDFRGLVREALNWFDQHLGPVK